MFLMFITEIVQNFLPRLYSSLPVYITTNNDNIKHIGGKCWRALLRPCQYKHDSEFKRIFQHVRPCRALGRRSEGDAHHGQRDCRHYPDGPDIQHAGVGGRVFVIYRYLILS